MRGMPGTPDMPDVSMSKEKVTERSPALDRVREFFFDGARENRSKKPRALKKDDTRTTDRV
jgi:hypothetical protein